MRSRKANKFLFVLSTAYAFHEWDQLQADTLRILGESRLAPRMFGGRSAGGVPKWMVVLRKSKLSLDTSIECGGTLVAPGVVLTSAKCAVSIGSAGEILALKYDLSTFSSSALRMNVLNIILHPEFNPLTLERDIAVIRVSGGESINSNILIGTDDSKAPNEQLIYGWGGGSRTSDLQMANVKLTQRSECQQSYEAIGVTVGSEQFCAAGGPNFITLCHGDQGGPIGYYDPSTGLFYQTGIASWTVGCSPQYAGYPSIFTSITKHHDWIYQSVDILLRATASAGVRIEGDWTKNGWVHTPGSTSYPPAGEAQPPPPPPPSNLKTASINSASKSVGSSLSVMVGAILSYFLI